MAAMTRIEAEKRLKAIFGIEHFYDEQWKAIDRILRGERILMIERTGFGKSLCYQFPATQFPGITVIFSPLIALMRDQVHSLNEKGISAAYVNSEQSQEDNALVVEKALKGEIKILYIAPERQENQEWIEAAKNMNLSMVVIDEAHTISTWGHDFRPAFRRIINLVQLLPQNLPVLATTATATKRVQRDIEEQIGGRLTTIRGNLSRENLYLQVIRVNSEDEKMIWLASNLDNLDGTGLIYTGTRVDTEVYAHWLQYCGIDAIDYNAGYDADTRKEVEKGLMENRWKCIVSTNALGMGIDKPDIRFIIHTQIPASPIHYYQEIGRAGRDGLPTRVILFFNENKSKEDEAPADYSLPYSFIESSRPGIKKYERVIDLLKQEPLSEREIMKKANLKQNQIREIKADLIDQGIIKEAQYGTKQKKYEYQYKANELDVSRFEELRKAKIKDLDSMVGYVYTDMARMEYLCRFLDSNENSIYTNCDNTNLEKLKVECDEGISKKLEVFRDSYFPKLELADYKQKSGTGLKIRMPYPDTIEVLRNNEVVGTYIGKINYSEFNEDEGCILRDLFDKYLHNASRLTDGYAASYYGVSNIGTALHRSKYEGGGDFPDFLLKKTLSVFGKKYRNIKFDLVLYVPPTHSGNLVRNFAIKFANAIKVPISHSLIKTRETEEQKVFQNSYGKRDNVKDAFTIDSESVRGKTVLLIDDIYDSGATLKEIGRALTEKGAAWIVPIVIAKTVGGTL